jgi:hypothetical protein
VIGNKPQTGEMTMSIWDRPGFLRTVLFVDAATCVATGLAMSVGSNLVARLTQLPAGLIMPAGMCLFPIAAFIVIVATRSTTWLLGVWLVIFGNIGWIVGSLWLLIPGTVTPNGLGYGFIMVQATTVAVLAELEFMGVQRTTARL